MNFSYLWDTLLVADNQSTIGRKYWGPLGDLFLLVINPQFSVAHSPTSATGDPNGTFYLTPGPGYGAEIVIVQGYKLLNPTGDPVASRLSAATRQKILQLDPFYMNLGPFFPADGSVPDYSTLDPSTAVDPYVDPSTGSDLTNLSSGDSVPGDNRAALIAQYSVDNGVEVDLTTMTTLTFQNIATNQSTYNASVQSSTGNSGSVTFDFLTFSSSSTSINGSSLQIGYQASFECSAGQINTAKCKLVRNQIESDLDDIQIWWDKQFSTFMFRLINTSLSSFSGIVFTPRTTVPLPSGVKPLQNGLNNVRITLSKGNVTHKTMTDHNGQFQFYNIKDPGQYVLTVGNKAQKVNIQKGNNGPIRVENVKRIVNPKTSPIWELHTIGIPPAHALAIKKELHKKPSVNRDTWEHTCTSHGLSTSKLEQKAEFVFGSDLSMKTHAEKQKRASISKPRPKKTQSARQKSRK
jgi:hypothetical protein